MLLTGLLRVSIFSWVKVICLTITTGLLCVLIIDACVCFWYLGGLLLLAGVVMVD